MMLAAHQPNFIPHLPFFDKMNKADVFVVLVNCQFEKNGYQNRSWNWEKWQTKPIKSGTQEIRNKQYMDGQSLVTVNMAWIHAIAMTFGIDTAKIRADCPTTKAGTERLINLCKLHECDRYLTNPAASDKYLDVKLMNSAGIEVVAHDFPYRMGTLEAIEQIGISGITKILQREKAKCRA